MIITRLIGGEQADAAIASKAERTLIALQRKIFELLIRVQSKIQGNLAVGIGLKSQHGTSGLAGSVRVIEPTISGTAITGSVEGGGGPFWYGRMWEYEGHKEIVPVNKKALAFMANGKQVFAMRVAAQSPRPWFVPPFEGMKPEIIAEISQTARGL